MQHSSFYPAALLCCGLSSDMRDRMGGRTGRRTANTNLCLNIDTTAAAPAHRGRSVASSRGRLVGWSAGRLSHTLISSGGPVSGQEAGRRPLRCLLINGGQMIARNDLCQKVYFPSSGRPCHNQGWNSHSVAPGYWHPSPIFSQTLSSNTLT